MEVTLAMGGGGARGIAHVGVIRRLEKNGIKISGVTGTSFGGIVAAFYALGFSADQIEEAFRKVDQNQLFGHTPDQGPSLLGIAGFAKWLTEEIGEKTFDDLNMPCILTAGDLNSGREVLLSEGPLVPAILATIAMPGVFPATVKDNWELVDGGTVDPVPVLPARQLFPNLPVVAVVLNDPIGAPAQAFNLPKSEGWTPVFLDMVSKTRYIRALDVFLRSLDIITRTLAEERLLAEKPEIIIRPPVQDVETLGKVDVHSVVLRGELATEEKMNDIRALFTWQYRVRKFMHL
jgi:NTE family protein